MHFSAYRNRHIKHGESLLLRFPYRAQRNRQKPKNNARLGNYSAKHQTVPESRFAHLPAKETINIATSYFPCPRGAFRGVNKKRRARAHLGPFMYPRSRSRSWQPREIPIPPTQHARSDVSDVCTYGGISFRARFHLLRALPFSASFRGSDKGAWKTHFACSWVKVATTHFYTGPENCSWKSPTLARRPSTLLGIDRVFGSRCVRSFGFDGG